MSVEMIAGVFMLLLQLAGIIWAAGKFSSSVEQLNKTAERLEETVSRIGREVINLHVDVEIIKNHIGLDRRKFKEGD